MKVARFAYEHEIPCFCADLTVNPILVESNKNVAARLKSFPGYFGNGNEDFSGDTFSRKTGLKHSLESISGMLKAEKESEGRIMLVMFLQNEKAPK